MSDPIYTQEQVTEAVQSSVNIVQVAFVEAINETLDKETAERVFGLAGIKMLQGTAAVLREAYADLYAGSPVGSLDDNPPTIN